VRNALTRVELVRDDRPRTAITSRAVGARGARSEIKAPARGARTTSGARTARAGAASDTAAACEEVRDVASKEGGVVGGIDRFAVDEDLIADGEVGDDLKEGWMPEEEVTATQPVHPHNRDHQRCE